MKELLSNVGSGGGAPATAAPATSGGGGGGAAAEVPKEEKEEEKEESDDDMVRFSSLFDVRFILFTLCSRASVSSIKLLPFPVLAICHPKKSSKAHLPELALWFTRRLDCFSCLRYYNLWSSDESLSLTRVLNSVLWSSSCVLEPLQYCFNLKTGPGFRKQWTAGITILDGQERTLCNAHKVSFILAR